MQVRHIPASAGYPAAQDNTSVATLAARSHESMLRSRVSAMKKQVGEGDMNRSIMVATMLVALIPGLAIAGDSPAPDNAKAYLIWPKNGTTIKGGKFWARFGLRDMGIAPAGVEKKFTGHHHLIIDAELPPFDEEIPADRNYVHYGKGYSEGRVKLPPGKHTLQLVFADHEHIVHNPPVFSEKITVYVPAN